MAQLPTLYKAAHVYLVSRRPPAVDSKGAVPLHVLLRALRSPLCAAAQWATHPGLRSAPILLKFLKNDAALAVIAADSDKADCAALFMHRYHNSFRTAMKALDSNLGGVPAPRKHKKPRCPALLAHVHVYKATECVTVEGDMHVQHACGHDAARDVFTFPMLPV